MKRYTWLTLAGVAVLVGLAGTRLLADSTSQPLHFPIHGFSIAPLEGASSDNGTMLMMFLPAPGGYTPNVNLTEQRTNDTITDFITLTKNQCIQSRFQVIRADKLDDTTAVIEYAGDANGALMHWYAKASHKNGQTMVATAAATDQQWPVVSAQLQACVDSFQRDTAQ